MGCWITAHQGLILKVGSRREVPPRSPRNLGRVLYTAQGAIGISRASFIHELAGLGGCPKCSNGFDMCTPSSPFRNPGSAPLCQPSYVYAEPIQV